MHHVVRGLDGYRVTDLQPVAQEAFADYIIPMRPDEARLTELLTRRGWDPAWSSGLFDGTRLVGFWLTGRDDAGNDDAGNGDLGTDQPGNEEPGTNQPRDDQPRNGQPGNGQPGDEAYCIVAGIVPAARGSGGLDALYSHVLAATDARPHRLEVIRGNERAARAYRRLGLHAARTLHYVQLPRATAMLGETRWRAEAQPWDPAALPPVSWLAHPPSWQNRRTALGRSGQPRLRLTVREAGALRGSAVLFPDNGDLAEIAVDPAARGRGVGRALLTAALAHAATDRITLATVDARDDRMCAWLDRCGAQVRLSQDEMVTGAGNTGESHQRQGDAGADESPAS